jgi:L-seryl-tRNA(Ser) seleniumtransferase
MTPNMLRNIPPVNELLESKPLQVLAESVSRNVVVAGVRSFLDNLRGEVTQVAAEGSLPSPAELGQRIADWIVQQQQPRLRDTINATGVLLHTGLGRAPLAQAALDELVTIGSGYSSLEIDLESGFRSQRHLAVQHLLTDLTGAESALVVNNNAGATVLTLAALAAGKEVIVSRGELVEIGGSYRLPDVMSVSGAILREVGTTNKTRIDDYAAAIGEETAALMRVHTSNYEIVGFTEKPSIV